MIGNFKNLRPKIHESCFIAPTADVIGDVTVGENSSIWHRTVLRGDVNKIVVGANTNIQDGSIVHVADDYPTIIGDNVTIGHGAIVHGCTVKDGAFIGMGAIILDGAVIGEGALIGAGALVTEGKEIPPYSLAVGVPAKVVRELSQEYIEMAQDRAVKYAKLANEYKELK
ncbi:MAG: gamma carbonic anhydrase family protein [Tepidanaerobacteraceae bacterium]|jgi:carbonic anhydrase/acetyltransferase-like protein (isoleucine patch superfamily)|nr:gamma carbonic anhydrase family protein [Tepidanaerobacter sp.]HQA60055.1 gamma carbonic anhydrase family protein [Tepidanaerobacteraceae bacterium]HQE05158.1 gamma carbonic anhydrase family protein [Tepidanaerobacteraceae bacterium]